jgi:hypothetical protein
MLRIYYVLLLCDLVLIAATAMSDLGLPYSNRFPLDVLDLKREANVAVWYSSLQLVAASALAFIAGLRSARHWTLHFWAWIVVAAAFLSLSIDETAQIHERIGARFTTSVGAVPNVSAAPSTRVFGWVPALALPIAGFLAAVQFAVRRWRAPELLPARRLTMWGVICFVGVIAAEIVEAYQRHNGMDRGLQGVAEEGLEIIGATLFVIGLTEFHTRFRRDPRPFTQRSHD